MSNIEIQSDVNLLRPVIRGLAQTWLKVITEDFGRHYPGLKSTRITETWRSKERQAECCKIGTSKFPDGFHCYGMAWDFACFDDRGALLTKGEHEYYAKCGLVAEALGLLWGGSWIRADWDHIQIRGMTLEQVKSGIKGGAIEPS